MTTLSSFTTEDTTIHSPTPLRRKRVNPGSIMDYAPWPEWGTRLEKVFGQAVEKYLAGHRGPEHLFTQAQATFLGSLGSTPQEIYDFVEDWCEYGEPSFVVALRITEVRAEYFLLEQQLQRSQQVVSSDSLPSKEAQLEGFPWLPRIIAKARAKLRGEMSPDLMYGCLRDRAFLRAVGIDPAQFLRVVWRAGEKEEEILEYVKISAEFHELLR